MNLLHHSLSPIVLNVSAMPTWVNVIKFQLHEMHNNNHTHYQAKIKWEASKSIKRKMFSKSIRHFFI